MRKFTVTYVFSLLSCLLILASCTALTSEERSSTSSSPPTSQNDDSIDPIVLEGIKLYQKYCASCHFSYEETNKRGRTLAQIKTAISVEPSMQNLANISDADLQKIAAALSYDPKSSSGRFRLVLANRKLMSARLKRIFLRGAPSPYPQNSPSDNDRIANTIDQYILFKVVEFGGPCTRYEDPDQCFHRFYPIHNSVDGRTPAAASSNEVGARYASVAKAETTPLTNILRVGNRIKACEGILDIDQAVDNALTNAGLSLNSAVSTANAQKLVSFFLPTRPTNADAVSKLTRIGLKALEQNMAARDAWRYMLLPLCTSNLGAML